MKRGLPFSNICLQCCKKFPSKYTFELHFQRKHMKRRMSSVNYKEEDPFHECIFIDNELKEDVKSEEINQSDELEVKVELYGNDIVKSYVDVLNSSMCEIEIEEINVREIEYFKTRAICKFCNKNLSKKNMKRHIFLCHTSPSNKVDEVFTCAICDKDFKNKSLLARHNKNVHLQTTEILCKICKKQFSTHDTLRRHVQIVHSSDINVTCTICNKKLKHKYGLMEHMRNMHGSRSRIPCEICKNKFWKKSLKQHISRKHAEELQQSNINYKTTFLEDHSQLATPKEIKPTFQGNNQNSFNGVCSDDMKEETNSGLQQTNENLLLPNLVLVVPKPEIMENLLDENF